MITHPRVLDIADQTEPYQVNGVDVDPATVAQPSDWNADHDVDVTALRTALGDARIVALGSMQSGDLMAGRQDLLALSGLILFDVRGYRTQNVDGGCAITLSVNAYDGGSAVFELDGSTVKNTGDIANAPVGAGSPGQVLNAFLRLGNATVRGAWEAESDFNGDSMVIIEADHIWTKPSGWNTTGASRPDFEGGVGSTAADDGFDWTDYGPAPTGGAVLVYALVGPA